MSKANQLGAGRFGQERRTVSARRAAIAAATGVPTEGVAPPTKLSPHMISLNPDNPRTSLGNLTDLVGSLRDHGQKVAVTVMHRDAYERAYPEKAAELEKGTTYVAVDGSSRVAAAREAGLEEVKVMVDDEQGVDENTLLESALVANIHRQDLDPLDEARALERLLRLHGSQRALAKRIHRSQGWVSQRLALLGLAPELAEALERGTENVELLRMVGNKPKEQQQQALEELKQQRAEKAARAKPAKKETVESDYVVITALAGPQEPEGQPREEVTEPRTTLSEGTQTQVPEPRQEPEEQRGILPPGSPLPYDQGFLVGRHLALKMDTEPFLQATTVMVAECWDKAGTEPSLGLLRGMLENAVQCDGDAVLALLKEFVAQLSAKPS
ncbi:ParB/RepB/Spo0J family partition protein [Streptomyces sp. NPDC017405]|uniref:ParB/RepB/Spo0J family partition protein n=1 Tax=unclassified Streptomyces TaxID=2593676 RepID=UPI0037BD42E4